MHVNVRAPDHAAVTTGRGMLRRTASDDMVDELEVAAELRGVVIAPDGRPVPGVGVQPLQRMRPMDHGPAFLDLPLVAITAADGSFAIRGVRPRGWDDGPAQYFFRILDGGGEGFDEAAPLTPVRAVARVTYSQPRPKTSPHARACAASTVTWSPPRGGPPTQGPTPGAARGKGRMGNGGFRTVSLAVVPPNLQVISAGPGGGKNRAPSGGGGSGQATRWLPHGLGAPARANCRLACSVPPVNSPSCGPSAAPR